ncbi:MAG: hypothetical protein QMD12_01510 [Candidatus Aenigmarchaeota archaeon]|nr:hypothetical protein [Candidatus Aenigmarchaeota archaeon]
MPLTLADITPVALCIATQDLFDAKRFQSNFCDNILLRMKDEYLEPSIVRIKRDLNSSITEKKFLEGHKAAIISNIDKIIGLVASRYARVDLKSAEGVVAEAKELIEKVMLANSFEDIARLEPVFRSKITLSVYSMFIEYLRMSKIQVI